MNDTDSKIKFRSLYEKYEPKIRNFGKYFDLISIFHNNYLIFVHQIKTVSENLKTKNLETIIEEPKLILETHCNEEHLAGIKIRTILNVHGQNTMIIAATCKYDGECIYNKKTCSSFVLEDKCDYYSERRDFEEYI